MKSLLLCVFLFAVTHAGVYERLENFFNNVKHDPYLMKLWEEHMRNYTRATATPQQRAAHVPHFNCHNTHAPNGHVPSSVHNLHPANVKVVAAMGDSLTAGMGILADNILQDLTEYRGHSWSIGGDSSLDANVLTFPNILRKFGNSVHGYSRGTGGVNSAAAGLNVAVSGDKAENMPQQARNLISRMKSDHEVNFVHDWKVVTLFIGANDLCAYCHDKVKYSAHQYMSYIKEALDILHADLPKTFVNLVLIFDIAPVAAMANIGLFCGIVHVVACDCGNNLNNAGMLLEAARQYQGELENLINSGRYDTKNNFTVVTQPFFKNTVPPINDNDGEIDMSYFAPDCFHFSEKGHAAAAMSLWNNMFEAPGQKREDWHLNGQFHCPGTHGNHGHQFFTTSKN